MKVAALIVAAGRGTRAGGEAAVPKQYVKVVGEQVLLRSARAFALHPRITQTLVAIHADDEPLYELCIIPVRDRLLSAVVGGATRQDSVRRGLEALRPHKPDLVLIHDAARPFVDAETIDRVLAALGARPGAIAAVPLADTLKRADPDGTSTGTVERAGLWRAQTPQGFRFDDILAAHTKAAAAGRTDFTDDAAVAEWAGLSVALVLGSERNVKITTAEDIAMAERTLSASVQQAERETRVGNGFDVHRLVPGDHVWLCGLKIAHTATLEGHSDADVALHALTDAILGAIGDGDIGQHFPPSDPKWKGAASDQFLRHAVSLLEAKGGRIVNADITILAEAPKISPHRTVMCARVAEILGTTVDRVSVKATTTEQLGFTGRREGIAAIATASVSLPVRP